MEQTMNPWKKNEPTRTKLKMIKEVESRSLHKWHANEKQDKTEI